MCDICVKWKNKQVNSKEAMVLIGNALKQTSKADAGHLKKLASKILDVEVPFDSTSSEAERAFWKRTHRRKDEEY